MGAPMARHLHGRGLLAAVGNRTQAKADALAAELKVRAARSADNFADCEVVVLCVSLDIDVIENVNALANVLKAGSVVSGVTRLCPYSKDGMPEPSAPQEKPSTPLSQRTLPVPLRLTMIASRRVRPVSWHS